MRRKKLFLSIIMAVPLSIYAGGHLSTQRLVWQMENGDVRNIARLCRQYVQKELKRNKKENVEELLCNKELARNCYMAQFFTRVGKEKNAILKELKDREFVDWLLKHSEIFEKLAFAQASGKETLAVLRMIWLKEGKELSGLSLNMALGAGILSSERNSAACEERYDFYKKSWTEGGLFPQFMTLEPWELAILFRGREDVADLAWAQDYSKDKKSFQAHNAGRVACSFIPYRKKNKQGISVHAGSAFYDNKPISLSVYVEYGGVCGAVSKGAAGFVRARGIPSYTIGQPGHCAFVWKGANGEWEIGNDIHGWVWSEGGSGGPWKGSPSTIIAVSAFLKSETSTESTLCYYLSLLSSEEGKADWLLKEALKRNAGNFPAWQEFARKNSRGEKGNLMNIMELFKQAFPENPSIWEYFLKEELSFVGNRTNGYAIYAGLLNQEESRDAFDVYMRHFCALARRDIPEMSKVLTYDVQKRDVFFQNWLRYYQKNKVDRKIRVQTCTVLTQAIPHVLRYEKTALSFLDFYGHVLGLWKDKQLSVRGDKNLTEWLKIASNASVRKKIAETGLKIAEHLEDNKALMRYAEVNSDNSFAFDKTE